MAEALGACPALVSNAAERRGRRTLAAATDEEPKPRRLGGVIRNKQRVLQAQLSRLQSGELEARMSALRPRDTPFALLETIAQQLMSGRTTIIAEVTRTSPSESLAGLANRCAKYVEWGADALSICTDEERSPNGAADLISAIQAVNVPVMRKDWIIHPLQVAETREAGAAGLTAVYPVLRKGAQAILAYAVSLGLDTIVEVVNLQELEEVSPLGVPLYGINLSVGLSLALPGLRQDVAKSLVGNIPFGATSVVGVWSIDEARLMKAAGADAVYVRHELLQGRNSTEAKNASPEIFLESLRDALQD